MYNKAYILHRLRFTHRVINYPETPSSKLLHGMSAKGSGWGDGHRAIGSEQGPHYFSYMIHLREYTAAVQELPSRLFYTQVQNKLSGLSQGVESEW